VACQLSSERNVVVERISATPPPVIHAGVRPDKVIGQLSGGRKEVVERISATPPPVIHAYRIPHMSCNRRPSIGFPSRLPELTLELS